MRIPTPYSPRPSGGTMFYVNGPGNGTDYHHGTLWPHMRLSTLADAEAAAHIANEAYKQGYLRAQADIRSALGVSA